MSVVSYEVAHALNQRAGRSGIPLATRIFVQRMKVYGELMKHGKVVPHPTVLDELARRLIIRASAREALEEHEPRQKRSEEQLPLSRPTKTFEPGTSVSFTDTPQANEQKRQCEDDIWDPRL